MKKTNPINLQLFAEGEPPAPPPAAPGITPPQAVSVDIDTIATLAAAKATEAADKKNEAVFKSMLTQHNLDAETIAAMTAEYKAKQTTPEQELATERGKTAAAEARATAAEEKGIALSKGIPIGSIDEAISEKVTACLTLAKSYVTADVPFEAALDKALKIVSFEDDDGKKPPMWAGSGSKSLPPVTLDEYKKMPYAQKLEFKEKNPTIYEQFKKALGFK